MRANTEFDIGADTTPNKLLKNQIDTKLPQFATLPSFGSSCEINKSRDPGVPPRLFLRNGSKS